MKKIHKKQKEAGTYSILQNVIFLLREIAGTKPFLFVLIILEVICSIIAPIIGIYMPSLAVELVTDQADITGILLKLGGLGGTFAIIQGFLSMAAEGKYYLYNDMRMHFQQKLLFKSLHCDYVHVESKEGMKLSQRATDGLSCGDQAGTSRMLVAVIELAVSVLSFAIYSSILAELQPIVVIVLIAISLVNLILYRHAQNYEHEQRDSVADLNQKLDYVENTAKNIRYAKDIRLYNMSEWFLEIREKLTTSYKKLQNRIQNRFWGVTCINTLTRFLRDGLAYGYLIYCVINRQISINEFVLYFGAITGFAGFVGSISDSINWLRSANLQMNDMRKYLDLIDGGDAEPEHPAKLSEAERISIEFDHVWFSYEKDAPFVLQDFCLHISEGEKLALVGVNGAGKTTLVKLLCGFYKPDRGEIRIGGVDIRQYRKEDLYKLFSAVFQDLYIDPFTVAENVSMALETETDMERVEECLERTGLLETIKRYPDHIHSYMNKSVFDGIVLSGGQQQKLLMARALYKDAPIMILDEPTSALDPIAESETYENFHKLTGERTVIYISHRLASTRFCDRIVFLKDGRNTECGSHEELMKLGREYAEMFEVQSHYYQKGGDFCED